mmetsp:Transcript_5361/g.13209  ORF Transcript_5361/g.13209 Transcript_5361/m.13209 type:complete len:500 (-) Transcript_5361:1405-2904(-)
MAAHAASTARLPSLAASVLVSLTHCLSSCATWVRPDTSGASSDRRASSLAASSVSKARCPSSAFLATSSASSAKRCSSTSWVASAASKAKCSCSAISIAEAVSSAKSLSFVFLASSTARSAKRASSILLAASMMPSALSFASCSCTALRVFASATSRSASAATALSSRASTVLSPPAERGRESTSRVQCDAVGVDGIPKPASWKSVTSTAMPFAILAARMPAELGREEAAREQFSAASSAARTSADVIEISADCSALRSTSFCLAASTTSPVKCCSSAKCSFSACSAKCSSSSSCFATSTSSAKHCCSSGCSAARNTNSAKLSFSAKRSSSPACFSSSIFLAIVASTTECSTSTGFDALAASKAMGTCSVWTSAASVATRSSPSSSAVSTACCVTCCSSNERGSSALSAALSAFNTRSPCSVPSATAAASAANPLSSTFSVVVVTSREAVATSPAMRNCSVCLAKAWTVPMLGLDDRQLDSVGEDTLPRSAKRETHSCM